MRMNWIKKKMKNEKRQSMSVWDEIYYCQRLQPFTTVYNRSKSAHLKTTIIAHRKHRRYNITNDDNEDDDKRRHERVESSSQHTTHKCDDFAPTTDCDWAPALTSTTSEIATTIHNR